MTEKHRLRFCPIKSLLPLLLLSLFAAMPAHAENPGSSKEALPDIESEDRSGSINLDVLSDRMSSDNVDVLTTDGAPNTDNNNLWQRIKNGYAMNDQQSPLASAQESWYAARPQYVSRMVERSQKYLYHIVEEVEKRGMPTEIALLPMVESAFNPQAYSRSRASGIWQFMPATGKTFGLKQNWWVDNRRDVMAATDAALTYLEKLHVMFGTWELALAAYNAGEGTVQRAIERNRKKGLPTDYASLSLPQETREYVPKLQAVKNIVSNPEQYGLEIQPISNQPYFTKVSTTKPIDSRLAAKLAGISLDEFNSLNPAHNRPVLGAGSGKSELLLPVGNDQEFQENLANYDKPLVSWQAYQAKRGEKLTSIAHRFNISLAQLRDVNNLSSRARLKQSQPLLVPISGKSNNTSLALATLQDKPTAASDDDKPSSDHTVRYTVRKGDTASSIAKRYGLSTKSLLTANQLSSSSLKVGHVLVIASAEQSGKTSKETRKAAKAKGKSTARVTASRGKRHYTVRRGETLSEIAQKFNVATSDLQRWNNLDGTRIVPGHKLTIYQPDDA